MSAKAPTQTSHSRSQRLRRNVLYSLLIKGGSIASSLVLVPITLDYLTDVAYGIWMAISNILVWFMVFDVGLGNGMRNFMAQAIALSDWSAARRYLATTLVLLTGIAVAMGAVTVAVLPHIDLAGLLSVTTMDNTELRDVIMVAALLTFVNFVVKNVGVVYMALQKYAVNDLLVFIGHLLSLLVIAVLKTCTDGSLLYVMLAFCLAPVLTFIVAGGWLFGRYKELRCSIRDVDLSQTRKLMGKSLSFFAIQITSCLVIYGSANVFISHFCGPQAVTPYTIAYRYFNILTTGFTILIAPLWSAYTEAQAKDDWLWIGRSYRRSLWMLALCSLGGVGMLALSPWMYNLWVGSAVEIPWTYSVCVLLYILLFNANNCVTYLLNGLNTIRVQLITSVTMSAVFLGGIYFAAPHYGVVGISLCMSASYAVMLLVHSCQAWMIVKRNEKRILNLSTK